jgi:hypothetical protein
MDDQTTEIAKAKGTAKVRGPFEVTCSGCGRTYWPDEKEKHLSSDCFPPTIHVGDTVPEISPGESAGDKWRLMKSSSITSAERKALGLTPRRRKGISRKKSVMPQRKGRR